MSSGVEYHARCVQLLQSLETDLKRYQQGVSSLGSSEDGPRIREELVELRDSIKEKFNTAHNDIAQQRQKFVVYITSGISRACLGQVHGTE